MQTRLLVGLSACVLLANAMVQLGPALASINEAQLPPEGPAYCLHASAAGMSPSRGGDAGCARQGACMEQLHGWKGLPDCPGRGYDDADPIM